jgi:hypothetical protein
MWVGPCAASLTTPRSSRVFQFATPEGVSDGRIGNSFSGPHLDASFEVAGGRPSCVASLIGAIPSTLKRRAESSAFSILEDSVLRGTLDPRARGGSWLAESQAIWSRSSSSCGGPWARGSGSWSPLQPVGAETAALSLQQRPSRQIRVTTRPWKGSVAPATGSRGNAVHPARGLGVHHPTVSGQGREKRFLARLRS